MEHVESTPASWLTWHAASDVHLFRTELEGAARMTLSHFDVYHGYKPLQGSPICRVKSSNPPPHPHPPPPPTSHHLAASRQSGVQFNQSFAATRLTYWQLRIFWAHWQQLQSQSSTHSWSPTVCLPPYSARPLSPADAYRPNSFTVSFEPSFSSDSRHPFLGGFFPPQPNSGSNTGTFRLFRF